MGAEIKWENLSKTALEEVWLAKFGHFNFNLEFAVDFFQLWKTM